ncbi:hypothetical protein ACTI_74120 [Actinoplanes sp. OR16]|nr:hypothetical protein ACTI_74120 [Actinoplanes sp. OR16]
MAPTPETVLARINRAGLDEPLFVAGRARAPSLEQGFLRRDFRCVGATGEEPLRQVRWSGQPVRSDLDMFLAAYLATPDAARGPLLVLSPPGGGKTLLLSTLAARLPPEHFTVIRVPLDAVNPGAPVSAQVHEALWQATNGRVSWPDVGLFDDDGYLVLLVDGVDAAARPGYLSEVAEFQRRESLLGRPVAVIAATDTGLAGRLRGPDGMPVLLLEPFDDERIRLWLDTWNAVNSADIAAGRLNGVGADTAGLPGLGGSPELLTLMTLVLAENGDALPRDGAARYKAVLELMLRRRPAPVIPVEESVRLLGDLAITTFHHGLDTVGEDELTVEPHALRWLMRCPFVSVSAGRSYGLLDSQTADFLVADRLVVTLAGREPFPGLQAMLSHRVLAARPRVLDFVAGLSIGRHDLRAVLRAALAEARGSAPPPPVLAGFATLTANLVLLAVTVGDTADGVAVTDLMPPGADPGWAWRCLVLAWDAGLPRPAWHAIVDRLELIDGHIVERTQEPADDEYRSVAEARLRGETSLATTIERGLDQRGDPGRGMPDTPGAG